MYIINLFSQMRTNIHLYHFFYFLGLTMRFTMKLVSFQILVWAHVQLLSQTDSAQLVTKLKTSPSPGPMYEVKENNSQVIHGNEADPTHVRIGSFQLSANMTDLSNNLTLPPRSENGQLDAKFNLQKESQSLSETDFNTENNIISRQRRSSHQEYDDDNNQENFQPEPHSASINLQQQFPGVSSIYSYLQNFYNLESEDVQNTLLKKFFKYASGQKTAEKHKRTKVAKISSVSEQLHLPEPFSSAQHSAQMTVHDSDKSTVDSDGSGLVDRDEPRKDILGNSTLTGKITADNFAFSVDKRTGRCSPDTFIGNDLPWTCRQGWAWRHLGENVYPSRVYEAVCEGSTCMYGHFNCTPISYTLQVLQACPNGCQDMRVPQRLRNRWEWSDLSVTVGCMCSR